MAFLNTTQATVAFKNLLNKSNTDVNKAIGNEAEGIFFNVPSTAIWVGSIDPTPAVAIAAGVAVSVTADMVLDNTSNGHAYFATWPFTPPAGTDPITHVPFAYNTGVLAGINSGDRIRNAIPAAFGTGYEVKPFDTSSNAIAVGDVRNWLYQYNSGIFFQQDNLGLAPLTMTVFPYIGETLFTFVQNGGGGGGGGSSNIDWQNAALDILFVPPPFPAMGDRYLVGPNTSPSPSGLWLGQHDKIAEWTGSPASWHFTTPQNEFAIRVASHDDAIFFYEGTYPGGQWVKEPLSTVRGGVASGTNNYSVTVTPPIDGYSKDLVLLLTFTNPNTGAATLDVNVEGSLAILKSDSGTLVPLVTGDILSNTVYMVVYDGTQFQLFTTGGTTIGTPTSGDYITDGLFPFVPGTKISDATQSINDILKALAPPPAPILSDWSGSKAGTTAPGKLSFDSTHPIAGGSYVGADLAPINPISVDGLWAITGKRLGIAPAAGGNITGNLNDQVLVNSNTPTPAYEAKSWGDADKGLLKLFINGTEVVGAQVNLVSNPGTANTTSGGTLSGFVLSAAEDALFPQGGALTLFKHRTGTWLLRDNDPLLVQGYNYVIVEHVSITPAFDRILTRFEFVIDDNVTATSITSPVFSGLSMTGSKFISGIDYFTGGSIDYDVTVDNLYRNTYYNGNAITFNDQSGGATAPILDVASLGIALAADIGNELKQFKISNVDQLGTPITLNIFSSGKRRINDPLEVNITARRTVQGNTTGGLATQNNILLDNVGATSTNFFEGFDDEAKRLINANGGLNYDLIADVTSNPWDSTQSLTTGSAGHNNGLQVISGTLVYPVTDFSAFGSLSTNLDFGNANADYSAATGSRTFTRYFLQVSPTTANFVMTIDGSGGTFVDLGTALTGNNIHVEIKAPTQSGWMDAYNDFATGLFADGDGARNASAGAGRAFGTAWGLTIGTLSTANTGGYMVVRVTVGASFTGSFTDINWTFS